MLNAFNIANDFFFKYYGLVQAKISFDNPLIKRKYRSKSMYFYSSKMSKILDVEFQDKANEFYIFEINLKEFMSIIKHVDGKKTEQFLVYIV